MLCWYIYNYHVSWSMSIMMRVSNINYRKQKFHFAKLQGLKSCFVIINGENVILHFKSKRLDREILIKFSQRTYMDVMLKRFNLKEFYQYYSKKLVKYHVFHYESCPIHFWYWIDCICCNIRPF